MNVEVADFLKEHEAELLENWVDAMKKGGDDRSLSVISDEFFQDISKEFIEVAVSNIIDSESGFNQKVERFTEKVVRIGWELAFLMDGLSTLKGLILGLMRKEKDYSSEETVELITEIDRWVAPMTKQIVESYSNNWEKIVSLQKVALQELSAPLIPVFEKISVMPLVGTIDTERARLIMENLLSGVVKHRSEVVLIDITGVPVVDTMVAHHIIQAADAVRLVGSRCMLVGIRPEIAQTIVNLGIHLNQITTTSTLQKGIEKALEFTNRKIVALKEGSD
ncbi:MAG TPA: STAS domain-containing protein [Bacillus bacterium]|uniref:Modulator protein RsbR n=1 Tax=Siminovitchia fordii TaxID=254759 RepID=A0ABQ4KAT2_9BACI|nr:STAS domain-containing protein [Siminovitchia fordii]GIN22160.1 modulator protein RsbR [Siminovitchia fordii]HBZ09924.1 STAS domain-containing protein [Bacillus sp. (in: firmicutes)]